MKKMLHCTFAFILIVMLLAGSMADVLAESIDSSIEIFDSSTPIVEESESESSSSPDESSSSVPEPVDSSVNSTPASSMETGGSSAVSMPENSSTIEETDSSETIEEESEPTEEPAVPQEFIPLVIEDFSVFVEAALGEEARLYVELNRDDVDVRYQWQVLPAQLEEDIELLFDYSETDDPSYFFPYADISEAELLALNSDAVWPGVEICLEKEQTNKTF